MSADLLEALLAVVNASDWSDPDKELARELARDYRDLLLEALAGRDVKDKLAMVQAGLLSVGAAGAVTAAKIFRETVASVIGSLLKRL
ncbi:MAG: hypothetical protein M0R66_07335 [Candidatus Omnitrophica bacterium]|jgi:hypothetical protein|nr:hypothetical protein [Candidatus Omnitrophota bacterium]